MDANQLRASAALGIDADAIKNDPLQIGSGILGNIALQKNGEIVNDTAADPRAVTIKGTEENPAEHIMGVPILLKDKLTDCWQFGAWARTGLQNNGPGIPQRTCPAGRHRN